MARPRRGGAGLFADKVISENPAKRLGARISDIGPQLAARVPRLIQDLDSFAVRFRSDDSSVWRCSDVERSCCRVGYDAVGGVGVSWRMFNRPQLRARTANGLFVIADASARATLSNRADGYRSGKRPKKDQAASVATEDHF
jgi:hypothetical protein